MTEKDIKNVQGRKWGQWQLDITSPPSLNFPLPWYPYEIALFRCRTAWRRQLWLEHMAEKRYVNKQDLVDLQRAFNDLVAVGMLPADITIKGNTNGQRVR